MGVVDLGTGPRGLTSAEAATRLAVEGPNALPVQRKTPAWRLLAAEMVHFFALLSGWLAGWLSLAGMPQLGIAVFVVIVLNGLFAFVQEQRAEHAAEKLRGLLPRQVTVVRDGATTQVPAEDLVTDDVVLLAEGDRVSADLRLDLVPALAVDTSALTGESVADHPAPGDHVYAGCFIVEGEAQATVVASGARTRLAGIAKLTQSQRPAPTPLRLELDRVSRIIAAVAIAVGVAFFSIALLLGTPASNGFLFAVGVTVAVVPCGLLPTVTLSLAIGAQRMAQRRALVRHLEAVETLGSTTFICTDKTGTLTQNEMSVVEIWMPKGTATVQGNGYEPTGELTCTPPACRGSLAEVALAARVAHRAGQCSRMGSGWPKATRWKPHLTRSPTAPASISSPRSRPPPSAPGSRSTPAGVGCRSSLATACSSRAHRCHPFPLPTTTRGHRRSAAAGRARPARHRGRHPGRNRRRTHNSRGGGTEPHLAGFGRIGFAFRAFRTHSYDLLSRYANVDTDRRSR